MSAGIGAPVVIGRRHRPDHGDYVVTLRWPEGPDVTVVAGSTWESTQDFVDDLGWLDVPDEEAS